MARSAATFRQQALVVAGPAFAGLDPYFGGLGATLTLAEGEIDNLIAASLLSDATGAWLDLVGEGDGFRRLDGEDDATYRARIGALPGGTGLAEIEDAVNLVLTGAGFGACLVIDRQQGTYYAAANATASTELQVELFADGNSILINARQVYVICPEVNDDAVELAVCQAAARPRAAGVQVRVVFLDDYTPAMGYAWDEA